MHGGILMISYLHNTGEENWKKMKPHCLSNLNLHDDMYIELLDKLKGFMQNYC